MQFFIFCFARLHIYIFQKQTSIKVYAWKYYSIHFHFTATLQHFHLLHFHFFKWKLCLKLSQIPECVFKSIILLTVALYESLWTWTLFLKLPLNFKFASSQHLCYVLFKSYWIYTVFLKFSKLLSFISKTLGHLFGVSLNIGKHFSKLRLFSRLTLS